MRSIASWMVPILCLGCSRPPPNLLLRFEGQWIGDAVPESGERRALTGDFTFDDELGDLVGDLAITDPDATRILGVQSSESIEELGIALYFTETAGVRELWTEAEPPSQGFWTGPYRTSWGCTPGDPDDPDGDGVCGHSGTLQLSATE